VPQPDEDTKSTQEIKPTPDSTPDPRAAVYFGGYTFPSAVVIFTVDGETVFTVSADSEGYFEGSYDELDLGEHIFSFQAQSYDEQESRLVSYSYSVQNESPLYISTVLLPPIFASTDEGQGIGGVAIPGRNQFIGFPKVPSIGYARHYFGECSTISHVDEERFSSLCILYFEGQERDTVGVPTK
jgi:hypothetical protein